MDSEYRWLTADSKKFLERDYLLPGVSVNQRVEQIASKAHEYISKYVPDFKEKFIQYMKNGWYSLSTPIWCNYALDRGYPISCFGSYIEDSIESILNTHSEVGMMTKYGGGTSGYFGNVRPRNSPITNNGESHGSVHFMRLFDTLVEVISQGKARRGSFAAYLPIDHKDILEFLDIRTDGHPLQEIYTGVCVPNWWLKEMIDGDADKRKVWAKVLTTRTNIGFPYIFFTDNVNNGSALCYRDKYKITHSNLCVTGDQRVVTSTGLRTVKDLYESGESLTLFDGEKSVAASPMRLVEKNVPVYKITTKSGKTHRVTDYHKLKTKDGMVACKDLMVGDKVATQRNRGLFGKYHDPDLAFLLGTYQANGTQSKNVTIICVWEHSFDLIPELEKTVQRIYKEKGITRLPQFIEANVGCSPVRKKVINASGLRDIGFVKGVVPEWVWTADDETQWAYIRGLYYADGTVGMYSKRDGAPCSLSLCSVNKDYLRDIQMILSNLGVKTSIYKLRDSGLRPLPDGVGGYKSYQCKPTWRLVCSNKPDCLVFEKNTGFISRKNCTLDDRTYRDNTKKYDEIVSIEFDGIENVYCTTVDSDDHVWVCNGFITSNCSEITLPDSEDESFVCDLSSMNLTYYDEWKDTDAVLLLTYFLDAVMQEFIEKTENEHHMRRARKFAERHRALGIGVIGYHTYLQKCGIPFESLEAKSINNQIFHNMYVDAYTASNRLAGWFGPSVVCQESGIYQRNTTLLAIAPTKSSSFILGQASEAIEPHRSNYYIKDLQKLKSTFKNPELTKVLQSYGKDTEDVWQSILLNGGSVQHLDFLTEREKNVFKTFSEISPMEIIIQAGQRQKYIDQSQSLNLMIDPKVPAKELNALILEAWKAGVKTLYYQISVSAAQQLTRSITNCTSCES